jgi:hypothetical protein
MMIEKIDMSAGATMTIRISPVYALAEHAGHEAVVTLRMILTARDRPSGEWPD